MRETLTNYSDIFRKAHFFAMHSLRASYQNTFFGIHWITISVSLLVLIKVVVFSGVNISSERSAHIISGFILFAILRYAVLDGVKTIKGGESFIQGGLLSVGLVVFAQNLRLLYFTILIIWPAILYFIFQTGIGFDAIVSFLFIFAFTFSISIFCCYVIGYAALYYPDLNHFLNSLFSVIFFLSPIIWMKEDREELALLAALNPITYYLDAVRRSLIYKELDLALLFTVASLTIILTVCTLVFRSKINNEISRNI